MEIIAIILLLSAVGGLIWQYEQAKAARAVMEAEIQGAADYIATRRDCPHCMTWIDYRATVCPECKRDVELERPCPNCGAPAMRDEVNCSKCRQPLPAFARDE